MIDVVQKLWGFCHILRHDGIGYGEYLEQITYLLFLKMADERSVRLPPDASWTSLREHEGPEVLEHYANILRILSRQAGLLGQVFDGAQSLFGNPANLKRLLDLVDETHWTALDVDIKAAAFEGLLERAASEGKKGAGQYFTPRPLIRAIVQCMKPDPRLSEAFNVGDPACGTGGFLVGAYEWLKNELNDQKIPDHLAHRIRVSTYFGQEIDQHARRLALMNLYLHGIEPDIRRGDSIYDVYTGPPLDVILTNPPFGTRGANQVPFRPEFSVKTSNKQLNFLQHILTILKSGGRAAVIVPDSCLFVDQAGQLLEEITTKCSLHTVLRLPRGTFTPYSPGTKTNVLFFTKGLSTDNIWIYDGRSNVPAITKKDRPLTTTHFAEFVRCYGNDASGRAIRDPADSPEDRWRQFSILDVKDRDFKLDSFRWLHDETSDDSLGTPEPEELITDAMAELQAAMEELSAVLAFLDDDVARSGTTDLVMPG